MALYSVAAKTHTLYSVADKTHTLCSILFVLDYASGVIVFVSLLLLTRPHHIIYSAESNGAAETPQKDKAALLWCTNFSAS